MQVEGETESTKYCTIWSPSPEQWYNKGMALRSFDSGFKNLSESPAHGFAADDGSVTQHRYFKHFHKFQPKN